MILTVAAATCRESLRSRTFVGLLLIYAVFVLLSRLIGWISATDGNIVTTDVVFSLQSVFGVLVAVATGTALMQTEITQKTLYTVLSRPLARWHFVLGKFLGLAAALVVGQACMLILGLGYLALTGAKVHGALILAGFLTAEEVVIMAAVSLAMTTLSTPLLAAVLSLAVYAMGHAVTELPGLVGYLRNPIGRDLVTWGASLVPDLGRFAYRNRAVYGQAMPVATALMIIVYGAAWIALLVTITVAVFRRRQL